MTFIVNGQRLVAKGAGRLPLLEIAQQSDLTLPYSCGTGNCGTCKAKLTEGAVARGAEFALSAEQQRQGLVLVCIARAASPCVTVCYEEP